jgi:hypothetical protein
MKFLIKWYEANKKQGTSYATLNLRQMGTKCCPNGKSIF